LGEQERVTLEHATSCTFTGSQDSQVRSSSGKRRANPRPTQLFIALQRQEGGHDECPRRYPPQHGQVEDVRSAVPLADRHTLHNTQYQRTSGRGGGGVRRAASTHARLNTKRTPSRHSDTAPAVQTSDQHTDDERPDTLAEAVRKVHGAEDAATCLRCVHVQQHGLHVGPGDA
jgi:hypothetical protein